ncbi:MAG: putative metal-dependent TIM-barrel fold amidohydrolase [Microbacteriaceae bacterium]|jgi:predicted TIM-barrel fold metal-dependent hydrolase|nr:putative metal-dependent TIM-barrel fold amidohydrolase [Microbacteriaceae bacterium]HEV7956833.1 amidohydrolase family protein [Marisediminicola sp.]
MTRYEPAIDVSSLRAIDTHVHVQFDSTGRRPLPDDLLAAMDRYFGHAPRALSIDELADFYRERSMAAVVFTVDARTAMGVVPNSSEEIAAGAARHPDVLIPFGSVDPRTGSDAIELARRLVADCGVRGFKFHPSVQAFDPSGDEYKPLWGSIEELGVPAIFHTGQTGVGAGLPGGAGIKLRYSNPMLLDEVAADFPGLNIILAHPSVPWQDEALSMAAHKANVFIDLSGWSPKYFSPELVRQAGSILQDKMLFGSDFPALTPDRWLDDFARLELKDAARPKILKDNAVRLLGLA